MSCILASNLTFEDKLVLRALIFTEVTTTGDRFEGKSLSCSGCTAFELRMKMQNACTQIKIADN